MTESTQQENVMWLWHTTCFNYFDKDGLKNFEKSVQDWKGVTYALEIGDKVKIGSTRHPYQRIQTHIRNYSSLGLVGEKEAKFGCIAISVPCFNYRANESQLHKMFEDKRIAGTELFSVTIEDVIHAMETELDYICFRDKASLEKDQKFLEALIAPIQNSMGTQNKLVHIFAKELCDKDEKLKEAEAKIKDWEEKILLTKRGIKADMDKAQ